MRMNRLGNSDLVVSAVGAGTWAMGGDFFGAIDDKKCIDSLCASLDHGVNLIDTAPIYGKGHSETLVGQAIKGRRDKVVLCTKVGLLFDDPKGRQGKCLQPDSIEYEIEQSLRRLGTDYIDLYRQYPFDLVLSGHTHGGQVRIPLLVNGLFAPDQGWFPQYAGGLYEVGETSLVVSRGLSYYPRLPRVFDPPEVVVIDVEGTRKAAQS